MTQVAESPSPTPPPILKSRHILSIAPLSREEIIAILDLADRYVELNRQIRKKQSVLSGRTQINLFFEASTRTQSSFELAGKRLGADVMNMSVSASAVAKGETLLDTAMTLNAMQPDLLIVRHHASGAAELRRAKCPALPSMPAMVSMSTRPRPCSTPSPSAAASNASRGWWWRSPATSPTPGWRLNLLLFQKLGAEVRLIAPSTLLPAGVERLGATIHRDMREGLKGADVVMMLRLQLERMSGAYILHPRILPLLRPRCRQARRRQAGSAGHASGSDEPRCRDRPASPTASSR